MANEAVIVNSKQLYKSLAWFFANFDVLFRGYLFCRIYSSLPPDTFQ